MEGKYCRDEKKERAAAKGPVTLKDFVEMYNDCPVTENRQSRWQLNIVRSICLMFIRLSVASAGLRIIW